MLIKNNGTTSITMNLRDGSSYVLLPGVPTSVPDVATTMIDDSAVLISLFNAGTLTVTTDAGGAFSGFPTTVNATDSAVGKLLTVHAKVGPYGSRTLVDSTGGSVGGNFPIGSRIAPVAAASIAASLPKYTAALQLAAQRKKPTFILVLGDSTEANLGGNTGTNGYVGARKMSHAAQLARMLGASDQAFIGAPAGTDVTPDAYDERVSPLGAGVSVNANVAYMGGGIIQFANGATGAYTVTPRGSKGFDRVRVIYGRIASGGATNMSLNVGGASVGTFNALGGTGLGDVQMADFTCSYSSPNTAISISGNGGATNGACNIMAVIPWDSADPGVIVMNGGTAGASAAQFMSLGNPWTCRGVAPVLAPDLTLLNLWINDVNNGTAPATYQSLLGQIRDYLAVSSDIVYMGYQPINVAGMTNGQGDAIWAAMQSVAGTSPVVDLRNVFGSTFAALNALGVSYDSALHINAKGQYYKAAYMASLLAP